MAKGNDGNYLQHCIEVEAAVRLSHSQMNAERRLHIALAHGMAPFEQFEGIKSNQARDKLLSALKDSNQQQQSNEPAVVAAYRKTEASSEHYPNTAELLRAVVGLDKLVGGITEIDCRKFEELAEAWSRTSVIPARSSWRKELGTGGTLTCPNNLEIPWLFTMDPMTYSEKDDKDDDKLHRSDIAILSDALSRYFDSGRAGIVALFVYSVGVQGVNAQCQFWTFLDDLKESIVKNLAEHFDIAVSSYWLPHKGGNRNLAGLLQHPYFDLSATLESAGLNLGAYEKTLTRIAP